MSRVKFYGYFFPNIITQWKKISYTFDLSLRLQFPPRHLADDSQYSIVIKRQKILNERKFFPYLDAAKLTTLFISCCVEWARHRRGCSLLAAVRLSRLLYILFQKWEEKEIVFVRPHKPHKILIWSDNYSRFSIYNFLTNIYCILIFSTLTEKGLDKCYITWKGGSWE